MKRRVVIMKNAWVLGFLFATACASRAAPEASTSDDVVMESPFAAWSQACAECVVSTSSTCGANETFQFACPAGCVPPILASASCTLGLANADAGPGVVEFCCGGQP